MTDSISSPSLEGGAYYWDDSRPNMPQNTHPHHHGRVIPELPRQHSWTGLHHRDTAAYSTSGNTGDIQDDYVYNDGLVDEYEEYPEFGHRNTYHIPDTCVRRRHEYMMDQNSKLHRQATVEFYEPSETYLPHPCEIELSQPTMLLDKIKDRLCDYVENPTLFIRLGCSIALHTVMGAMLTTTVLGAGVTLGFSAPVIGMIAMPALILGTVGGGVLGFHNDFVLNKSLLPKDFNWLDGLTRTIYLPKYTFPVA